MMSEGQFGVVPDRRGQQRVMYTNSPEAASVNKPKTGFVSREDMAINKAAIRIEAKGPEAARFAPQRGQMSLPFPPKPFGINRRAVDTP